MMKHFGDPCIHCGIPHDCVAKGVCQGDSSKAVVLQYWIKKQAYEQNNGADLIRAKLSTGEIVEEGRFPQERWWLSDRYKNATTVHRGSF